jgi:molybdenum-dependent DNA-binding transcriptional regulator ModE
MLLASKFHCNNTSVPISGTMGLGLQPQPAMNRLELLRIFATAAGTGSFRRAAQRLGVSPQTITRAVAQLEEELSEALFHRTSRQVRLTAYGDECRGWR